MSNLRSLARTTAATTAITAGIIMAGPALPAAAETADTQAPTVPGAPTFYYDTCIYQWTMGWTISTDNVDANGEFTYELYIDGSLRRTGNWTWEASQVEQGTHSYAVRAVDRAGNASAMGPTTVFTNSY